MKTIAFKYPRENFSKFLNPIFLELPNQHEIFKNKQLRKRWFLFGCLFIIIWQMSFFLFPEQLPGISDDYKKITSADLQKLDIKYAKYKMIASWGMFEQSKFVYFHYYLNLFPIATLMDNPVQSKEGAKQIIANHGGSLVNEIGTTVKYGDFGRLFLFLPWCYLTGSAENPTVIPFHGFMFILALILLYIAFWRIRLELFGAIIVLFLGSNPFQIFEVYRRDNVFGWPITTAILILALHVPLLKKQKPEPNVIFWATPVITGSFLAFMGQVRNESVAIIISVALCYFFIPKISLLKHFSLLCLLLFSFFIGNYSWESYFSYKTKQAETIVATSGGTPYLGQRFNTHLLWHPIFTGLGDFDNKYGYGWDDGVAAMYAKSVLKEEYVSGPIDEHPRYSKIIREKVLHDIKKDPLWYTKIILRRVIKSIYSTTPVSLSAGRINLRLFHFQGFMLIPMLCLLYWMRSWMFLKILLFTLPLSLPNIAIYSGMGMTNYAIFHLFTTAILIAWVIEILIIKIKLRRSF